MPTELEVWTLMRDLIDMRSFVSIWYWMAVVVVWSSASHFVLGVPYDAVIRARRHGGQAARDFEDLVRINVNRVLYLEETAGAVLLGLVAFLLTVLALLGFLYGIEFAQAVFLLGAPLVLVGFLTVSAARRIAREAPSGEALYRRVRITRIWIQATGMLAMTVIAVWAVVHIYTHGLLLD